MATKKSTAGQTENKKAPRGIVIEVPTPPRFKVTGNLFIQCPDNEDVLPRLAREVQDTLTNLPSEIRQEHLDFLSQGSSFFATAFRSIHDVVYRGSPVGCFYSTARGQWAYAEVEYDDGEYAFALGYLDQCGSYKQLNILVFNNNKTFDKHSLDECLFNKEFNNPKYKEALAMAKQLVFHELMKYQ